MDLRQIVSVVLLRQVQRAGLVLDRHSVVLLALVKIRISQENMNL